MTSPIEVQELAAREVATSVEVVAQVLGIPRSTAYALIRRGEFPVHVIKVSARRWIVPTQALLEVLGLDAQPQKGARLKAVP